MQYIPNDQNDPNKTLMSIGHLLNWMSEAKARQHQQDFADWTNNRNLDAGRRIGAISRETYDREKKRQESITDAREEATKAAENLTPEQLSQGAITSMSNDNFKKLLNLKDAGPIEQMSDKNFNALLNMKTPKQEAKMTGVLRGAYSDKLGDVQNEQKMLSTLASQYEDAAIRNKSAVENAVFNSEMRGNGFQPGQFGQYEINPYQGSVDFTNQLIQMAQKMKNAGVNPNDIFGNLEAQRIAYNQPLDPRFKIAENVLGMYAPMAPTGRGGKMTDFQAIVPGTKETVSLRAPSNISDSDLDKAMKQKIKKDKRFSGVDLSGNLVIEPMSSSAAGKGIENETKNILAMYNNAMIGGDISEAQRLKKILAKRLDTEPNRLTPEELARISEEMGMGIGMGIGMGRGMGMNENNNAASFITKRK